MGDMKGKVLSVEEWKDVQKPELESWTVKAFPDLGGKIERERSYQRQMLNKFRISGLAGIVVDVGCGPSPITEQIEGNFIGIGVDPLIPEYSKFHNVFAWKKTMPRFCKAEEILLPDSSAHHVISTNAIDHFQNWEKALEEIARIMKPGATFWLSFCINNASEGHPHPAHRVDLDVEIVGKKLKQLGLSIDRGEITSYGWRNQPSWLAVYRKY
jgi:SAM-dependent methyltransferase